MTKRLYITIKCLLNYSRHQYDIIIKEKPHITTCTHENYEFKK